MAQNQGATLEENQGDTLDSKSWRDTLDSWPARPWKVGHYDVAVMEGAYFFAAFQPISKYPEHKHNHKHPR